MKILVYGWYHQSNLGDELFMEAFAHLFSEYHFTFTNCITSEQLAEADAVFMGGGSFLNDPPIMKDCLETLLQKKIFYIGIGAETDIHSTHRQLLERARLIAIRTPAHLEKIRQINENIITIPDLIYCLTPAKSNQKLTKSILVLPNVILVPQWFEPHWKHAAWNYFKSEFAQCLDALADEGFRIDFLPMCTNPKLNDAHAGLELINAAQHRDKFLMHKKPEGLQEISTLMSEYDLVITQRYHGTVLADMVEVPYISIYHHDKLKDSAGVNLPYYGFNKTSLLSNIHSLIKLKTATVLPIDRNIYEDLKRRVTDALCRS